MRAIHTIAGSTEQLDVLQSLSWSPHRSRRALLTGTRAGKLVVWTQTPNDVPGVAHVPTINQWYGQELPNAIQEEQQQDQVRQLPCMNRRLVVMPPYLPVYNFFAVNGVSVMRCKLQSEVIVCSLHAG